MEWIISPTSLAEHHLSLKCTCSTKDHYFKWVCNCKVIVGLQNGPPSLSFSWVLLCTDADFTQCEAGMEAIFTLSPPFLSLISVAQLQQEPEANQLPHQSVCGVTSAIQHYGWGEENKAGTKLTAGNNYKWFPTSRASLQWLFVMKLLP